MIKHTETKKFDSHTPFEIKVVSGREDIKIYGKHVEVQIIEKGWELKDKDESIPEGAVGKFNPVEVTLKISGSLSISRDYNEWFSWWFDESVKRGNFQEVKVLKK